MDQKHIELILKKYEIENSDKLAKALAEILTITIPKARTTEEISQDLYTQAVRDQRGSF